MTRPTLTPPIAGVLAVESSGSTLSPRALLDAGAVVIGCTDDVGART